MPGTLTTQPCLWETSRKSVHTHRDTFMCPLQHTNACAVTPASSTLLKQVTAGMRGGTTTTHSFQLRCPNPRGRTQNGRSTLITKHSEFSQKATSEHLRKQIKSWQSISAEPCHQARRQGETWRCSSSAQKGPASSGDAGAAFNSARRAESDSILQSGAVSGLPEGSECERAWNWCHSPPST